MGARFSCLSAERPVDLSTPSFSGKAESSAVVSLKSRKAKKCESDAAFENDPSSGGSSALQDAKKFKQEMKDLALG